MKDLIVIKIQMKKPIYGQSIIFNEDANIQLLLNQACLYILLITYYIMHKYSKYRRQTILGRPKLYIFLNLVVTLKKMYFLN